MKLTDNLKTVKNSLRRRYRWVFDYKQRAVLAVVFLAAFTIGVFSLNEILTRESGNSHGTLYPYYARLWETLTGATDDLTKNEQYTEIVTFGWLAFLVCLIDGAALFGYHKDSVYPETLAQEKIPPDVQVQEDGKEVLEQFAHQMMHTFYDVNPHDYEDWLRTLYGNKDYGETLIRWLRIENAYKSITKGLPEDDLPTKKAVLQAICFYSEGVYRPWTLRRHLKRDGLMLDRRQLKTTIEAYEQAREDILLREEKADKVPTKNDHLARIQKMYNDIFNTPLW